MNGETSPGPGPRLFFLAAALGIIALSVALAYLIREFHLGWLGSGGAIVLLMVAMSLLVRAATRRMNAIGNSSPALARYNRRIMVSAMVYIVTFFGATYAWRELHWSGPALWAAAFASSLGVIGMIWAMARLVIEETDEYLRFRVVKSALFGIGGLLLAATVWGFLEQFGLVEHAPAWLAMPLFAILMGVGNCVQWVRS